MTADEKRKLGLSRARDYTYLTIVSPAAHALNASNVHQPLSDGHILLLLRGPLQGSCTECDGRDDKKEYSNICSAMKVSQLEILQYRDKSRC